MPAPRRGSSKKQAEAVDRSECTPCRGTGKVNSNHGGEPHMVTCPWCAGSGKFVPGRDAQTGEVTDPADAPA